MEFKQIQNLIKDFEKSSLTNLELEFDGFKIKLSKNNFREVIEEVRCEEGNKEEKSSGLEIRSPLVGTFYRASGPNKKPFVEVGDKVAIGQTLCIIEAMKIMNEINSPVAGVIESINASNGTAVGFDQILMVINQNNDSK